MSLWTAGAALGFGGMLVLTAAVQPRRWRLRSWLRARDPCAYVPWWTFFAPTPGVIDMRLLWREQLIDGGLGPWHEALPPRGGVLRAVWNPAKRTRKAVYDCGQIVSRGGDSADVSLTVMSLPYLMVARYVVGLPASPLGAARQFAVVKTRGPDDGDGPFELAFVSPWHRLPGISVDLPLVTSELREAAVPAV